MVGVYDRRTGQFVQTQTITAEQRQTAAKAIAEAIIRRNADAIVKEMAKNAH